jgi:hypothetical protein
MADQLPPSLDDLDNPDFQAGQQTDEQIAAAKAAEEATLKAEQEKQDAEKKAAEDAEKERIAGLKPGDEGYVAPTKDDGTEDQLDTAEDFYSQVDKQHGFESLTVDYGETDPLSPEGTYIREKAIIEKAEKNFEQYLKESDPRGYAFLLHRKAGGSEEDFFKTPSVTLPAYESFKNDVDLQKAFFERDLALKGIDPETATMIVEKAIKDNKLFEKSDVAYKAAEKLEKDSLANAEKISQERERFTTQAIGDMTSAIDDIITNSKTASIVIPDAKKGEFSNFVKESMFFDGENFFIIKPLNKENAAEQIQSEYFSFVKGNLADVVKRQAKAENTDRLRRRIKADQPPAGGGATPDDKRFIPLSEI